MSDKNGTSRQGACDRCRGQKLRCVGAGKPIVNSTSRFPRNAIPCDRCRRAKVECYSIRPAPRRTQTNALNLNPPSSERSLSSYALRTSSIFSRPQNDAASAESLLFPGGDLDNDRLSTLQSPMPAEWIAYIRDEKLGGEQNLGAGTPHLIDKSDPDIYQDTDPINIHDHNHHTMLDLMNPTPPHGWDSDHIDMGTYPSSNGEPQLSSALSNVRKTTTPTGGNDHRPSSQTMRSYSGSSHTTTKSSIDDLAKLHETLLLQSFGHKSDLTHLPDRPEPTPSERSIGQTLEHCQRFVSILKRIRYQRSGSNSEIALDNFRARGHVPNGIRGTYTVTTTTDATTSALELPILFSILSCYTSILASYKENFLSIIEAVKGPTPTIPPTLSGLRIDGFELDGHNTLQLECLLNVSYTLLEKAEGLLFGSGKAQEGGGSGGGIIPEKLATGLGDVLFEAGDRNENDFDNGYCGGRSEIRVKGLIRDIQMVLDGMDL
ncbi:hypothetical protein BDV18DRAFT_142570 [Aspergillus unguis]